MSITKKGSVLIIMLLERRTAFFTK